MGSAEEDEFHHRLTYTPPPPRKLANHPCVVPRKLRSAVIKIKRNHQVSTTTSSTLPEAKKSSLRVKKGIKLKKDVSKKRSRKQSTAITKDEEEVVETLNALAGIFSASSPPPPPLASSSSHSIAIIDTTPIQFQCSANNSIINTTTTTITQEETIIQTDEHKGVLLQPIATTNDDNKKTLLMKRCATHVYVSRFIKVMQFVSEEERKKGEEPFTTFTSQVSQNPLRQQFWTGDEYEERKSTTVDVLRWQIGGGTKPQVSPPQMLSSRPPQVRPPFHYGTLSAGCSKLQHQDKTALAFLPDIPLSLQLLCGEPP